MGQVFGKTPNIAFVDPQPGDVPVIWADSSMAKAILGMAPGTPLEVGLAAYRDWLQAVKVRSFS